MITVEIKINGEVIGKISAINKGVPQDGFKGEDDLRVYQLSNGKKLYHRRGYGALVLARNMLNELENSDIKKER